MRRALAGVAALVLAIVAAVPATAAPVQDLGASAAATPPITLISQPISVAPDGDFGVLVSVADPAAVDLAVDIYDRVEPGAPVGAEPTSGSAATFPLTPLPATDPTDPTAPRLAGFSIAVYERGEPNRDPAWGWRIDEAGVYPVRIRLWDAEGDTLGTLITSLIRQPGPDEEVAATEAAVLIEGHRPPPADAEVRAGTTAGEDGSLAADLAPAIDALAARPTLPATFSLTPDAVARMVDDADAAPVVRDLRDVLEADDRDVLDAPYVDIDPTSLVRSGLPDELARQRDLGRQTLRALLEDPVTGTWQVATRLDPTTVEELRQRGIFRLVVGGDVLTQAAGLLGPAEVETAGSTTPMAAASAVFALGDGGSDPVLAAHQLLARLAAAATDRTDPAKVIVDVRAADVDPDALDIVFDALAVGSPQFRSTTVDALLDGPGSTGAVLAEADPPALGRYPAELRAARGELASYASMVGDRPEELAGYERALAISAADELDLAERRADVDAVRVELGEIFGSIRLPEGDTVTLGAREGEFPLPIESGLDQPVQVVIQLEPASDRLVVPEDRIEATLDDERTVVPIDVRARASGDTPVRITVRSPDDGVVLAETRYVVRSTAVSGVGILLTVGAAGFLALWWGRHLLRARRAKAAV